MLMAIGRAQGDARAGTVHSAFAVAAPISFATLERAQAQQDHTVVQVRRFLDPNGQVVGLREELRVDADGSAMPPFSLAFLGVEGQLPGSALDRQWQATYRRHASLLHRHGGFRVRDAALADANYTIHEFGSVVRAGRSATRVVVFPRRLDKAIWLLDVDAVTRHPLYAAEYDFQFRLLSEIEVVSFAGTVQLQSPHRSVLTVHDFEDFGAAVTSLGKVAGLVEPDVSLEAGEYSLRKVHVSEDPLNNQRTLVLGYTDGIDEFFVTQAAGTFDVFAGLPAQSKPSGAPEPNTIARYRDPSMGVLLFWHDGVTFQVAGRGALSRLDEVARSIYRQALAL
jgi:hypothetical protein